MVSSCRSTTFSAAKELCVCILIYNDVLNPLLRRFECLVLSVAGVQCGDGLKSLKCSAVQFVFISFAAEQVSPNRRGGQGGRCSAQRGERHHLVLLFFLGFSDLGKSQ